MNEITEMLQTMGAVLGFFAWLRSIKNEKRLDKLEADDKR